LTTDKYFGDTLIDHSQDSFIAEPNFDPIQPHPED
jgi:hypothetical protein